MRQVEENLVYADHSEPHLLSDEELELIEEVKQAYLHLGFIGCTGCRYCMPCPNGVAIPEILSLYNEYYMGGQSDEVKRKYWEVITPETHSSNCVACGVCEEKCPQRLPIKKFMSEAARIFPPSE